MSNTIQSNKTHVRKDYKSCSTTCSICKRIGKQKSKQFNTLYALKYHLTTSHDRQDEIIAGVTRKQILQMIRAISQALELNMLLDIPKGKYDGKK
ncbi:MAG: hypothetical protein RI100_07980 [Nitrosarchaeum sp.]|jgi:hypothetical protein|uniref:hypothetical protein n=1 Tax=Nitrosarchaeum sp. TaxID=2026886 RepID=UPI002DF10D2C|nr:hypothetical protein [Nitrosarchaeum sp.]